MYLLLSKPFWLLWILPTFHSMDFKSSAFYIELSHQYSLGLSASTKVPSIVRGISACTLFHMSICQVKTCQAPCHLESSLGKMEVRDPHCSPFLSLIISGILVRISTFFFTQVFLSIKWDNSGVSSWIDHCSNMWRTLNVSSISSGRQNWIKEIKGKERASEEITGLGWESRSTLRMCSLVKRIIRSIAMPLIR